MADLKHHVSSCNFGDHEGQLLRTQIVLGIHNKSLQARILREDLSLEKVIQHCQAVEASERNSELLHEENHFVDELKGQLPTSVSTEKSVNKNFNAGKYVQLRTFLCKNCNYEHSLNECRAFGKICNFCQKKNYFEKCCNLKKKQNAYTYTKPKVHEIQNASKSHIKIYKRIK